MCVIVENIGQDSIIPVRRRMLIMVGLRHVLAILNSQKESEYPHMTRFRPYTTQIFLEHDLCGFMVEQK